MKVGKLIRNAGFVLAAAAAGAVGALLFAPQSGARTRRLIGRKTEDLGYGARQVYERIRESGNSAVRTLTYRMRLNLAPRMIRERLAR
jgi:gas vesicle protein